MDKPCPLCTRPDAAVVLDALKKGIRPAWKAGGKSPAYATFYAHYKKHSGLPKHAIPTTQGPVSPQSPVTPGVPVVVLSAASLRAMKPMDRLSVLLEHAVQLVQFGRPGEQTKVGALKAAHSIVADMANLEEREANQVDSTKDDATVYRSLQEKFDSLVGKVQAPAEPEPPELPEPPVTHMTPQTSAGVGIVH